MSPTHIWLRAESKPKEERTPLTPAHARRLIEAGYRLTVEKSPLRAFPDEAYDRVGCSIVETGAWMKAPKEAIILGLKELPEATFPLVHRHIYFAHVYKNQQGWRETLSRFVEGQGSLLDLEYLTDDSGRRVAAFGHWAGFVGAGVGVLAWAHQVRTDARESMPPLHSYPSQDEFVAHCRDQLVPAVQKRGGAKPRAMVMGAKGRCGRGATQLFDRLGIAVTGWDMTETAKGGPFAEILEHEIFVNSVLVQGAMPPFLTKAEIAKPRKLSVISDVSCDPNGPYNPLPVYSQHTNFARPTVRISEAPPLDVIAIDHLPSMLPKESSEDFSEQLLPHLLKLGEGSSVWERALKIFHSKTESLKA